MSRGSTTGCPIYGGPIIITKICHRSYQQVQIALVCNCAEQFLCGWWVLVRAWHWGSYWVVTMYWSHVGCCQPTPQQDCLHKIASTKPPPQNRLQQCQSDVHLTSQWSSVRYLQPRPSSQCSLNPMLTRSIWGCTSRYLYLLLRMKLNHSQDTIFCQSQTVSMTCLGLQHRWSLKLISCWDPWQWVSSPPFDNSPCVWSLIFMQNWMWRHFL